MALLEERVLLLDAEPGLVIGELLGDGRSNARVFVACGVRSVSSTSHMTRRSSPPRTGSGQANTGWSTQSELLPGAWFVLEPSKPQMGRSSAFVAGLPVSTLVFERRRAVGSVPSIQMYSAL